MLVSWSGIHFTKRLTLCYTDFRNQISTGLFRFIRNLYKFYFVHVSFYVERGYLDANMDEVHNIISFFLYAHKNAGQQQKIQWNLKPYWKDNSVCS